MSAIDYWKGLPLKNLTATGAIPPTADLIPMNASSAVEHARRISPQGAQLLSSAFDNLRRARDEIESMRQSHPPRGPAGTFHFVKWEPEKYLTAAFEGLLKAQESLAEIN